MFRLLELINMTFRNGFIMGLIAGTILVYIALEPMDGAKNQQLARDVIISFSILGAITTIYALIKRKSFINTTVNGFIAGFAFSTTTISWLLYGISYP